ncbi:MAG: hypothetical protein M0R03_11175 [Novosphingobium sp.]|nr:hypothetical protein [Novosphingobium sp.]
MSIGTELPFRRKRNPFATGSLVMDHHRAETVSEQRDLAEAARQARAEREARGKMH